jgi:DNA-binding response OmpR family regulator
MESLILVLDRDLEICRLARECLESAGYRVHAATKPEGSLVFRDSRPCLIVLGMNVLKECGASLQDWYAPNASEARTPRLVLLDKDSPRHRMIALDYGSEDCIMKPFRADELVNRVQAILRRSASSPSDTGMDNADLVIDSWAMKLLVRGSEVPATTLEFKLLEYLARHPGQVFTRDFLLDAVWGDMRFINPRSVDACIRRIREKIEPDSGNPTMLKTVRGVGYRMDATAIWQSAPIEVCDCPACRTRISALRFQESGAKRRRATI